MLCLNALWALQEGNVNDVRRLVSGTKPLAYTTVMTLLERLAKKGAVTRRKIGRAFMYSPAMSRDAMRRTALRQFVDCFFGGSEQELAFFLHNGASSAPDAAPAAESDSKLDAALL